MELRSVATNKLMSNIHINVMDGIRQNYSSKLKDPEVERKEKERRREEEQRRQQLNSFKFMGQGSAAMIDFKEWKRFEWQKFFDLSP